MRGCLWSLLLGLSFLRSHDEKSMVPLDMVIERELLEMLSREIEGLIWMGLLMKTEVLQERLERSGMLENGQSIRR